MSFRCRATSIASYLLLLALFARADEPPDFFERRIRPLLAEQCYECHSARAKKLKGGLRLDSREEAMKGGESGAAIVPGKPEESLLITAVRYHDKELRMPPPKDDAPRKLSDAQIRDLEEWVRLGAPMPADASSAAVTAPGSQAHWAFQPIRNRAVPEVKAAAWVRTDVDRFILARLEAEGLIPAPPADPRTLIRRMTFDLTGLPPSFDEVAAFAAEFGRDARFATANLIERLLASPHYGERWGRHWLDLARYADTKGYVYAREERFFVHAHAYRDWVIRAFNEDLPYDRFLLLQIAADQLVPPRTADLAAMGFLTGGRRFIGVTHDIIDDRIDVVTRATMALTVACARCHDHKYDPIPTQDYYGLYGVFHNTAHQLVRLGTDPSDPAFEKEYEVRAKKSAETMGKRREEAAARLRARVTDYLRAQLELEKYPEEGFDQILLPDDLIPASVRRWRDFLQQTKEPTHPIFAPWHRLSALAAGEFEEKAGSALDQLLRDQAEKLNPRVTAAFQTAPKSMREAAERYGRLFAEVEEQWKSASEKASASAAPAALADPAAERLRSFLYDASSPTTVPDLGIIDNELFFPTAVCEELWKVQAEVDRWIIQSPVAPVHALTLVDREPEPNPRVFTRGNPARRGEEVPRQFPRIAAGPEPKPFARGSGRLELAQAIVRPDNPLTARVMVNRIWQQHFGAGLVRTSSDFGVRAEPPAHPELLDWLAQRFVESGWSIKAMHRLILSSAVYQQGSARAAATPAQEDAENRLLTRFPRRRLDFEQIRDALLSASGELDRAIGGKPADLFTPANKRRTLYSLVDRQFLSGTFRVFDFANPDLHIAQRSATTVPQQALFFLNHTFVADRAKTLAGRIEAAGASSPEARVQHLHRSVYQRVPTAGEVSRALEFISAAEADAPPLPPKSLETQWRYGWGEYDAAAKRVKSFQALPHFTGKAWQGGSEFPDAKLGWAQLTAEGGHPGNDLGHVVIRRWIAPRDGVFSVSGEMVHEPEAGDGVRALIVSSRTGEVQSTVVHHGKATMSAANIELKANDTLDFIVDIHAGLNSDQFKWAPSIAAVGETSAWEARKEFRGPSPPYLPPLKPWEQYAHVLLLANEFSFVD